MSIDEIEDEIDSLDDEIGELERKRDGLYKRLQTARSGHFGALCEDVRERCSVLERLHLTGAEMEAVEDLKRNDEPSKFDLQRLKTIELNHLPETVFSGTCGHSVPSMRASK